LTQELGGIEHLDLHADRRVGRGGAVARTDLGEIDATIESQLNTAREIAFAAIGASVAPSDAPSNSSADA
ncbi:MAG: flagellar assembly protein FliH, partial [Solirubrobacteraceae bacterium]|nr:flagellar assembly protein FliH [Solirubrobacteraceae bacterium]